MQERLRTATPVGRFDIPSGTATLNGRGSLTLLTGRTIPWPELSDDLRTLPSTMITGLA